MLDLYAQPGDHTNHVAYLCQGLLNPLMALGGNFHRGSLSQVIHHEQHLIGAHGMGPRKRALSQVRLLLKGRTQGHNRREPDHHSRGSDVT
jgi:hypothetical protein